MIMPPYELGIVRASDKSKLIRQDLHIWLAVLACTVLINSRDRVPRADSNGAASAPDSHRSGMLLQ